MNRAHKTKNNQKRLKIWIHKKNRIKKLNKNIMSWLKVQNRMNHIRSLCKILLISMNCQQMNRIRRIMSPKTNKKQFNKRSLRYNKSTNLESKTTVPSYLNLKQIRLKFNLCKRHYHRHSLINQATKVVIKQKRQIFLTNLSHLPPILHLE